MNSDQNKNEILDVSLADSTSTQNNFPFANGLNAEMENVDYEALIKNIEEFNPTSVFAGIMSSIKILNKIISVVKGISKVRDVVRLITGQTGNDLIVHVEQLIQQTLTTQYRNAAIQSVNDIQFEYDQYLTFFEQWSKDKTFANGQMVETAFGNTNRACNDALNQALSRIGFETLLLPNYAIAASLHLLLLRDAVIYRREWLTPTPNTRNADHTILLSAIERYTNHCTRWYHDGLNRFQRSSYDHWVAFNTYRRDMTLSVLDLVAVFPTYDPDRYTAPTDVELTRIIYTDPIVCSWPHWGGFFIFDYMENYMTIPPIRASALNNLTIFTSYYPQPHNVQSREYWSGNRNYLSTGNNDLFGYISSERPLGEDSFDMKNIDIFNVNMRTHRSLSTGQTNGGVHWANFIGVRSGTSSNISLFYDRPVTANAFYIEDRPVFLPGESSIVPNRNDYTHRLLQIMTLYSAGLSRRIATFSHAWVHKSLNRENIFRSDRIAQIPAIKTESESGNRAILRGPGSTGGDIVRLDNSTAGLFYTLTPGDSKAATTRFIIRVRYASITNNRLVLDLNRSPVASRPVEPTVKSGGSLTNLRYQDFGYAEFSGNFNLDPIFRLGIFRDMPNTEIVIDKIELIPAHLVPSSEQENGNTTNL